MHLLHVSSLPLALPAEDDAKELRALAATAQRPTVRTFLLAEATRLEVIAAAAASATAAAAAAASAPTSTDSTPAAEAPVSPPAHKSAPAPADLSFIQPSYGFNSDGSFVEVMVFDLPGVGDVPKDSISCNFTNSSFDLRIVGLGGKNYRLMVPALEKEVVASACKLVVGKKMIKIKVRVWEGACSVRGWAPLWLAWLPHRPSCPPPPTLHSSRRSTHGTTGQLWRPRASPRPTPPSAMAWPQRRTQWAA